jgi:hypothetical protein
MAIVAAALLIAQHRLLLLVLPPRDCPIAWR